MHFREIKNIFLISVVVLSGCSESEESNESAVSPYLPFSSGPTQKVDVIGLQKLAKYTSYIKIEPGEFLMGSPKTEPGRKKDEFKHQVRLTRPFWISKFEVTNMEWNQNLPFQLRKGSPVFSLESKILKQLCLSGEFTSGNYSLREYEESFFLEESFPNSDTKGNWAVGGKKRRSYPINNKKFTNFSQIYKFLSKQKIVSIGRIGQKNPVTHISFSQATAFCWKKSTNGHSLGKLPKGMFFRLPTEAEWEYVCRAGTSGFCGLGSGERLSGINACINGSRQEFVLGGQAMLINRKKVAPIDPTNPKYPPNAWGIHDMHGNVMEWCHDFYGSYSQKSLIINPLGPFNGSRRVVRGGSFFRTAQECRSATRASYEPSYHGSEIGFRMVIGYPVL